MTPRLDPTRDILGIIDLQPCFMPGGELAVADGDAVVPAVNGALRHFANAFATQDWHPPGHVSFAATHGRAPYEILRLPYGEQVLWPTHAVQGTPGAALHAELAIDRVQLVLRKGFHAEIDGYSAFFENDRTTRTGLEGYLRERGLARLFLAGLAADFCVAWSAEDAARLGFEVVVLEDATRGIGLPLDGEHATTVEATRARLTGLGVVFASVGELG